MELGLKGKVALVGASSKGLGKAIALGLAEEGVQVTICARDADTLEETAAEIREKTETGVLAVPADVSQPEQVNGLIAKTIDRFGGIDILVSNAGGPRAGRFADLSPEDYQTALHLNLLSTINLCRGVVPSMKARGGGRIINLTSISVKQPVDGLMLSNMARTGVIGFAKTLASELASDNILVNNVCPGVIYDRFLLGDRTFRGFEYAGIGPRYLGTGRSSGLGGNMFATATAELKVDLGLPRELGMHGRIFGIVGTLTGIDRATVVTNGGTVVDSGSARASAGVGLSWSSPVGPVRIDWTTALAKESYDRTETILFSLGSTF